MSVYRSSTYSMPAPQPSGEAIQAAAAEAQAIRDAGADDRRNYVRSITPGTAIYGDPIEDLTNATPRERAMIMRNKARTLLNSTTDANGNRIA
jgi:hypothetical protein